VAVASYDQFLLAIFIDIERAATPHQAIRVSGSGTFRAHICDVVSFSAVFAVDLQNQLIQSNTADCFVWFQLIFDAHDPEFDVNNEPSVDGTNNRHKFHLHMATQFSTAHNE